MSVNYTAAVKTARMTATRDHFADGILEIGTAGMGTVLATFGLSVAGGSISTDTWTLAFDNNTVSASAAGVAAEARIKTSGAASDLTGLTVGTSGTDVVLDNTNIANGQDVTLTSAAIQHA
ncbi:hypothetical protein [Neptuniibacter halophilus]|uniref:hypothetical protein n=1 Tax=Neptuniibacter halophilus TaxID=651666 RepID=UPI00257294A7|nr:hypothetical protein [Neptuniibacter halophilus]